MQVQNWPVDKPKPYGRNPRVIPDRATERADDLWGEAAKKIINTRRDAPRAGA